MGYLSCQAPSHDDIAALVALDQLALGGLWSAEGYRREIDSPNSCLLMLVHRAHAIGGEGLNPSTASMAHPQPSDVMDSHLIGIDELAAADLTAVAPPPDRGPGVVPGGENGDDSGDDSGERRLLGLGCYWAILDEAHITVLAIDPRYQRRGLGSWLLVNLLLEACADPVAVASSSSRDRSETCALVRATLEVRPSNSRALALYESFGFESLGRRRRYYADGEDALILWQNSLRTPEFRDRLHQRYSQIYQRLQRQGWRIANPKLSANRT
ncbi:GNAT family N-acetyltransferase [Leptolyngbya sp. KIOST-1]|uniref:GNAT family N-acetyltransferase n=1 Tax=Leptolyngbya sp. KIOST-1 TaxID=1229172 RepID=UPI00068C8A24|nr:GNAT family N-acetyltransferase [Leptolyngbya sp. KIOST-1]